MNERLWLHGADNPPPRPGLVDVATPAATVRLTEAPGRLEADRLGASRVYGVYVVGIVLFGVTKSAAD